jgi:osmotically-inducible protein OsmY
VIKRAGFLTMLLLLLNACVSVIDATTDKPITNEPGERSLGHAIDDDRIETVVAVNIRKADPELRTAHVNVASFNGVVLLVGQVKTSQHRELAEATARQVQDVQLVHNELTVSDPVSPEVRANDSWLTTKIKSKFLLKQDLEDSHITVVTENGVVYLLGKVSHAQADLAAEVASDTSGVQKIARVFEYID